MATGGGLGRAVDGGRLAGAANGGGRGRTVDGGGLAGAANRGGLVLVRL